MHRHATMNRLYRLIWSHVLGAWVAVAENSRASGKRAGRKLLAAALAASATLAHAAPPGANQLPLGGQVIAGAITLQQAGAQLEVAQTSQRGIVEWQSFNLGAQASINYTQPGATAVTLNRILDTQASQIFGKITANGQVFLVNPNGVFFARGSSVDVGGLLATTHVVSNTDFMSGKYAFSRAGASGSVINEGNLKAALGGYIALLAPEVRNRGAVLAQFGTVALAAGEVMTLKIENDASLSGIVVTPSDINALVENGLAVNAPGGLIILSAQALNSVRGSVVNSGTLEASSLVSNGGRVSLLASHDITHSGTIRADAAQDKGSVGGAVSLRVEDANAGNTLTLDGVISARGDLLAGSADGAGAGGVVDTSAPILMVGNAARVDTRAWGGTTGVWRASAAQPTVAASAASMRGATLGANLATTNVVLTSTGGNLLLADGVTWSGSNSLTLNALRDVRIESAISNVETSGTQASTGKMLLRADSSGSCVNTSTACGGVLFGANGSLTAGAIDIHTNRPGGSVASGSVPVYAARQINGVLNIYNYTVSNPLGLLAAILPRDLHIDGMRARDRDYDGTTVAALENGQLVGVVSGESLGFSGARGDFADKNVGVGKAVSVTGAQLDDGGSGVARNYRLIALPALAASITPKAISVSGMSAVDKTYDGTRRASLNGGDLSGVVTGEALALAGVSASFADQNAGNGKPVTVSGFLDDSGSGQAANYVLTLPAGLSAAITPKTLTLAGMNAADKTYDGKPVAALSGGALQGLLANETLDILARSGNFADKNAGSDKPVIVNSVALGSTASGDVANYRLNLPTDLRAAILRKDVSVSGLQAADKTFDGTTNAALSGGDLNGLVAGESLGLNRGRGVFADPNVGQAKPVAVVDIALVDASGLASNYQLIPPGLLSAAILPVPVVVPPPDPAPPVDPNPPVATPPPVITPPVVTPPVVTPPVVAPPVITPPVVTPPVVTPPVVTPPVVTPPVVTPPPVITPPVVITPPDSGPPAAIQLPVPPLAPQAAAFAGLPALCAHYPGLPGKNTATGELAVAERGARDSAHTPAQVLAGMSVASGCQASVSADR